MILKILKIECYPLESGRESNQYFESCYRIIYSDASK